MTAEDDARRVIDGGRAVLGIELGSTRIKACLIDGSGGVLATGGHEWENRLEDGFWTYPWDDVWAGLATAYRDLADDARRRYAVEVDRLAGVGVSAMMHGYLAFDSEGGLLVPFRTWRNTTTGDAAGELTELLATNIPQRWSVAHLRQAVRDAEPHVARIASLTTLAGAVHRRLTGRRVLGVGDASGMFPVRDGEWDAALLGRFDDRTGDTLPPLATLLPEVLPAGAGAGALTTEGARLLDPAGRLQAAAPCCPPEGDAGTGMVATDSVRPREGNVSVGTSVFAMVVLEAPLVGVHHEIDLVTTPAGDPVAMVHCNNGASELAAWAAVFQRFAEAAGRPIGPDEAFAVLLREAMTVGPGAGGVLATNLLAGEPVVDLPAGRPLVVRSPDGRLTLADLMRAELDAVFAVLAVGMRVLSDEGVRVDRVLAHGGLLRTEGAAENVLAAALNVPVVVGEVAAEGGAWGMAILAAYAAAGAPAPLADWLRDHVFADAGFRTAEPDAAEVAAYAAYVDRYRAALGVTRAAVSAI